MSSLRGPNGLFYYKIKKPNEHWGNWFTKIAFYNINDTLIYYRSHSTVHNFNFGREIEFVRWSDDGNLALFIESYKRSTGEYVVLDLDNRLTYRTAYNVISKHQIRMKGDRFNGFDLLNCLKANNVMTESAKHDRLGLSLRRWYSKISLPK